MSFLLKYLLEGLTNRTVIEKIIKNKENDINKVFDVRQRRVYNLISKDYRNIYEIKIKELMNGDLGEDELKREILYYTYLLITDFVSCMTDNYSLELYRKLKGISIY